MRSWIVCFCHLPLQHKVLLSVGIILHGALIYGAEMLLSLHIGLTSVAAKTQPQITIDSFPIFKKRYTRTVGILEPHPMDPNIFAVLWQANEKVMLFVYKIKDNIPRSCTLLAQRNYTGMSDGVYLNTSLRWIGNGTGIIVSGRKASFPHAIEKERLIKWCNENFLILPQIEPRRLEHGDLNAILENLPSKIKLHNSAENNICIPETTLAQATPLYATNSKGSIGPVESLLVTLLCTHAVQAEIEVSLLYTYDTVSETLSQEPHIWDKGTLPAFEKKDNFTSFDPTIENYITEQHTALAYTCNDIDKDQRIRIYQRLEPQRSPAANEWYTAYSAAHKQLCELAGPKQHRRVNKASHFDIGYENGQPYIAYYDLAKGLCIDRFDGTDWVTEELCSTQHLLDLYKEESTGTSFFSPEIRVGKFIKIRSQNMYLVHLTLGTNATDITTGPDRGKLVYKAHRTIYFLLHFSSNTMHAQRVDNLLSIADRSEHKGDVFMQGQCNADGTALLALPLDSQQILYTKIAKEAVHTTPSK